MSKSSTLSTQKIFMVLIFASAALMASVFVFSMRQKQIPQVYNTDTALIFPTPREIKPFKLNFSTKDTFTQKNFYDHWTLLFFGFTQCSQVCPTTLDLLNRVYPQLQTAYPNLQVVLISLDPERDTPETVQKYARQFNPAFLGATGKVQDLRILQSQLGIYSGRDNSSDMNYQINHTSSILLIDPQGRWNGMFKYGMNPTDFIQTFNDAMQAVKARG